MVSLLGVTPLRVTDFPSRSGYQMEAAPQLVVGFCVYLPPCCDGVWLTLMQALCILPNCYEIMCASSLRLESIVSLILATTSGSYSLSAPSSEKPSEPCGERCDTNIQFGAEHREFFFKSEFKALR